MEFDRIRIEDRPLFESLLSQSPYVDCEYLFSTLFMWQDVLKYQRAIYDHCIYIRHPYNEKIQYHVPICPPDQIAANIIELMELEEEPLELFCVTKEHLKQMGSDLTERFSFYKNRNFWDYLYLGDDIRNLTGKKYHKKRNHASKFKNNQNWDFRIFTSMEKEMLDCMDVLEQWNLNKLENTSWHERLLVGNEKNALEKCMKYFDRMNLIGGILYIDGMPKGFTVGEVTARGGIRTGVVHYEKCDSSYPGIYQAINQLFAQEALKEADYINREDDMGVEGLRKSKLTYHPIRLVEKYTLKENE